MQEVATHLPSVSVSIKEAQSILQGFKNTVHSILERFHANTTSGARSEDNAPAKYFVARLNEGSVGVPVALFERTSENDSMLKPTYRMQRVILWEN